jgi:hypothetical protein
MYDATLPADFAYVLIVLFCLIVVVFLFLISIFFCFSHLSSHNHNATT